MNHHRYPYRSKLSPLFREIDDTCPLMNFYPIICYIYWNKGMQKEFYSIYLCSRYVHTHRYFQLHFNIREMDDVARYLSINRSFVIYTIYWNKGNAKRVPFDLSLFAMRSYPSLLSTSFQHSRRIASVTG